MIARRDVKKGDVIDTFISEKNLSIWSLRNVKSDSLLNIDLCSNCGRAIWTNCEEGYSSDASRLPRFNVNNIRKTSYNDQHQMYCSSNCKESYEDVMNIPGDTSKFFHGLFTNATKYGDIDDAALLFASSIYRKVLEGGSDPSRYEKFILDDNDSEGDIDERIRNCWVILRSEIALPTEIVKPNLLSFAFFHVIYKFIRRHCIYQVMCYHPIQKYLQSTMFKLSDDELFTLMDILKKYLPSMEMRVDEDANKISESVLRWRTAVRFVQATSREGVEDAELSSVFDTQTKNCIKDMFRTYFTFCSDLYLPHSCIPNALVESYESENGCMSLALIALHDVKKGEKITVSKIDDLGVDIYERRIQLESIFGKGHVCDCARCRCERCLEEGKVMKLYDDKADHDFNLEIDFHWLDMKHVADLAMQHAKYKIAYKLYTIILKEKPNLGDVLHARCASVLQSGEFYKSQILWKDAIALCPSHEGISLQVRKQNAYKQGTAKAFSTTEICGIQTYNDSSYITLIPSKCFVTNPDFPLISVDECKDAIKWAESEAKLRGNGWTTSRHYAVPTTDIPIHEIPRLLNWFNDVLKDRIRPLLAAQYGDDNVGKHGRNVCIHDAFIVRYDACGGQKHLPLHRDQSSHSFTIALNSTSEYDGGGTYIASLKRSIRPNIGGMTSFRGDQLLHGGDPVVRGRRYIIVAFCYISNSDTADIPSAKKMKLDAMFRTTRDRENGTMRNVHQDFSFGFQLG